MKIAFIACLFILPLVSSYTQEKSVPFVIGEWPPYTSINLNGYGLASEIVFSACKAAGMKAEFTFYPWKRAELSILKGKFFATFPYLKLPERVPFFYFSDPLFKSEIVIIKSRKNPSVRNFQYTDINSLKGFKTGTTTGSVSITGPLRRNSIECEETPVIDQSILKLYLGRIDLVIDEKIVIIDAVKRLYPDKAGNFEISVKNYLSNSDYRLIVSRKYPDSTAILKLFNEGLEKIRSNGIYQEIYRKFDIKQE
ncbi:MAG: transporter substrate-binding domain-containing protein [Brevinematales bacterium]|jgi:polar amino acid transport system substrate-binding protein